MTSLAAAQPARTSHPSRFLRVAVASVVLVILADWFFHAHRMGISAVMFALATGVAARIASARTTHRRDILRAALLLFITLVPLAEAVNVLSLAFAAAGLGAFVLMAEGRWAGSLTDRMLAVVDLYLVGPWRAVRTARRGVRILPQSSRSVVSLVGLGAWTVPLLLGGVFVMLFSAANPLVDRWLATVDPATLLHGVSASRIGLWLGIIMLTAPLLYVTRRRRVAKTAPVVLAPADALGRLRATFLSDAAILRSLIVFNLLFVLQSAMDLAYLWGGVTLPDGMSYAVFAVIDARREAERDATRVTVNAQAEREAADNLAQALLTQATAEADANKIKAGGIIELGEAEAKRERALNEARNALSPQMVDFELTKQRIAIIPEALEQAMKPIEKISDIRIFSAGNLLGAMSSGSAGQGGQSPISDLSSQLLSFGAQKPIIDEILAQAGFRGGDPVDALLGATHKGNAETPAIDGNGDATLSKN